MKAFSLDIFKNGLDLYGQASKENNAKASSELFTLDAKYDETPFDEPMIRRDAICQYWHRGAQRLQDNASLYQFMSFKDNLSIAGSGKYHGVMKSIKGGE